MTPPSWVDSQKLSPEKIREQLVALRDKTREIIEKEKREISRLSNINRPFSGK